MNKIEVLNKFESLNETTLNQVFGGKSQYVVPIPWASYIRNLLGGRTY